MFCKQNFGVVFQVFVILEDINDNFLEFNESEYKIDIIENNNLMLFLIVFVFDKDIGENVRIFYFLIGIGSK